VRALTLPNFLTSLRIAAVPVLCYCLVTGRPMIAVWIFIGAAVTDELDGLLARLLHQESALGLGSTPWPTSSSSSRRS